MDKDTINTALLLRREAYSQSAKISVEGDVTLPDYCSDIVKLLPCCASANITRLTAGEGEASIEGEVCCKIAYVGSCGKTRLYEYSYPFSRSVTVSGLSADDSLFLAQSRAQARVRAVSERRIDIRGTLDVTVGAIGVSAAKTAQLPSECKCHAKKRVMKGQFPVGAAAKSFTVSCESELDGALASAKVFSAACSHSVSEVKVIKNKLMVKGFVGVNVILLDDDGEFTGKRLDSPFNQIIELDGIDEGARCCVRLERLGCTAAVFSGAREGARLEASVLISALVQGYKEGELEVITDAYCSDAELECERESVGCVAEIAFVGDSFTVSGSVPTGGFAAKSAVQAVPLSAWCESALGDGEAEYVCRIDCAVIAQDENGGRQGFEKTLEAKYKKTVSAQGELCSDPVITVTALSATASEQEISITAEARIDGFAYIKCGEQAVISAKLGQKRQPRDEASLMLYFADEGESVWEIAKRFGADSEKISAENSLDGDVLAAGRMLVFELE